MASDTTERSLFRGLTFNAVCVCASRVAHRKRYAHVSFWNPTSLRDLSKGRRGGRICIRRPDSGHLVTRHDRGFVAGRGPRTNFAWRFARSARLAGMDRGEILEPGQSTNEKITLDLKNFLSASGIDGSTAEVSITDLGGCQIDLDDPSAREYALFKLEVTIPYENALQSAINGGETQGLTRSYTFRNARKRVTLQLTTVRVRISTRFVSFLVLTPWSQGDSKCPPPT